MVLSSPLVSRRNSFLKNVIAALSFGYHSLFFKLPKINIFIFWHKKKRKANNE